MCITLSRVFWFSATCSFRHEFSSAVFKSRHCFSSSSLWSRQLCSSRAFSTRQLRFSPAMSLTTSVSASMALKARSMPRL